MPVLNFPRFFLSLVSLLILALGAYALWSWYEGMLVADPATGVLVRVRESWRLWTGAGLLAWSFLGGRILPFILARGDTRPTRAVRGDGRMQPAAGGGSLYVETYGPESGPPIIFTHGWGMDSTFWSYARADLADRFRVVVWDLPGLGKSKAKGSDSISLSAYAGDLLGLIETVGGRPVLVGHSIGGMIIQTLLRDHPEVQGRLAGIVLLDTSFTNPLRTMVLSKLWLALQKPLLEPVMRLVMLLSPIVWLMKWQSWFSGSALLAQRIGYGKYVTRSQLAHTTLLATRSSPRVLARGDLAMLNWDATGALSRLRIPALVIGGDVDIVTKLEAHRTIASETPRARLEVVEGVNHMGPMERADVYDQLIGDFATDAQPAIGGDLPASARPPAGRAMEERPAVEPRAGQPLQ